MRNGMVFNHIPKTAAQINKATSQILRKGAFDIERVAKQLAPVDTGLLKNSIYTVTSDHSGGQAALLRSVKKRSIGGNALSDTFPELPPTGDPLRALVVVGAKYGIFVERGTRFLRARPFLLPAYLSIKPDIDDAFRRLEEMIRV